MESYKDAAIITVRNSSSRLPNKAIMTIKNQLTSIEIVINRAKKTNLPVILATSTDYSDDIFVEIAKKNRIEVFRGSLLNKIKRWFDCFEYFSIDNGLLLDGDDLCHNYDIGIRAINQLKFSNSNMIINPPEIITGFFTYAINYEGLKKIYEIVPDELTNTDVITRFIEKSKITTENIVLDSSEQNKNIRLTLDYQEDLLFFRKLYQDLDILESGKNIVAYLEKNSDIPLINFKKQQDFLNNQTKFNESVL